MFKYWVYVLTLFVVFFTSCSTTKTEFRSASREETARPRIEQRALSTAMDAAFSKVDFTLIRGKSVFVETQALSKIDVGFITAYVNNKIVESGGLPVNKEENADIKILNIVKVSGTDEIERWWIIPDKVTGQFRSTFSYVDVKTQKVLRVYYLDAEADETR
jgi:hypothetical protein